MAETTGTKKKRSRKRGPSNKALEEAKAKAKAEAEKQAKKKAGEPENNGIKADDILSLFSDEEKAEMMEQIKLRSIYNKCAKMLQAEGFDIHDPIILFEEGEYVEDEEFLKELRDIADEDDEDEDEDEDDIEDEDDEDESDDDEDEDEEYEDETIGRLAEYMNEYEKSQGWAAKKFGVSQATISNWLNESSAPRANTRKKIEKFLDKYA